MNVQLITVVVCTLTGCTIMPKLLKMMCLVFINYRILPKIEVNRKVLVEFLVFNSIIYVGKIMEHLTRKTALG